MNYERYSRLLNVSHMPSLENVDIPAYYMAWYKM